MPVLYFPVPPVSLWNALAELLAKHKSTTGAKALQVLLAKPGTVFDAIQLSLAVDWGAANTEPLIDMLYNAYSDIPVCDAQALCAYRHRLAQLEQIRAQRTVNDPTAACSDLDWEAAFLRAEIRNSTKPRGGIKNFRQTKKRAYKRLRIALVRLLKSAENPLLHHYISQNLNTGLGFVWLGDIACITNNVEMPLVA